MPPAPTPPEEPMEFDVKSRVEWYHEYLDDLLKKDVRDITEIRKIEALRKVARWLLSYSSKFFELKAAIEVEVPNNEDP